MDEFGRCVSSVHTHDTRKEVVEPETHVNFVNVGHPRKRVGLGKQSILKKAEGLGDDYEHKYMKVVL
jgi:hypothetical protein